MPSVPSKDDTIVIVGAGVFGLSTALELKKRGYKDVTVLDRFQPPVVDGSSVDISRIIRVEYADELYGKMAREALQGWTTSYQDHFHASGFVMLGESGNPYLAKTESVSGTLGDGAETESYADATKLYNRYPDFPSKLNDMSAFVNTKGGWADAESSIRQLSQECSRAGVNFITGNRGIVTSLQHSGKRVTGVNVAQGPPISAAQVILSTGAWTNRLLSLSHATTASGQPVGFIQLSEEEADSLRDIPVIIDLVTGVFVFPPTPDTNILKLARHGYGFASTVEVEDGRRVISSPNLTSNNAASGYLPNDADDGLREGLRRLLPKFGDHPWSRRRLCWYSDTPKGDFIVDHHPLADGLFVATGGAGHAFKFLPVLGRYITDCFENKAPEEIRQQWRLKLPDGKPESPMAGDGSRGGPPHRTQRNLDFCGATDWITDQEPLHFLNDPDDHDIEHAGSSIPLSAMGVFTKFRLFNKRLALACALIAVSTFNYGFDNQAFASTQAMDSFEKQFGVWDETKGAFALEPYWLSLFNSLNYIGFAAGVILGSLISSRWGRRWCMFVMSVYALCTATISVTSFHPEQIMAARVLNYVYVGMELGVVPTFQSEIVPAQARGFMVGSYQLSLAVGGLVINSVCFGTSFLPDNRAWRIPLGLFYIVPTIVVAGIWFIPESPRWLLRKDRVEEAWQNLRKLREGAFTEEQIEAEFKELRTSLEQEIEQGKFVELFQGNNLKRTAIVIAVNFLMQASGQAFVSQYGAVYVKSLGTINPFGFNLITASVNIVTLTCILLWTDVIGRRILMIMSSCTMFAAMTTMGGLGIESPVADDRKRGVLAMMAIFACGFSMGWAPLSYVVTTEVSALRLRDLTSRVGFTTNVIMNFTVNFIIPYLIYDQYAGLNSKVGFIFGALMAVAIVFVYFCVPECKGKTLEQVDFLFNQGVPIRDFGKVDAAAMMSSMLADQDDLGKTHESDVEKGSVVAAVKQDS
ncbi:hypothetical protein NM208_g2130 [Fusarium decemcellulare]|uniref:Uncharacterized protein n=2 Tax=Fusarium decemcellulare TaxID=57161 RepID=A0ACC1SNU7_9HYPO|nr:hypothetical protein NM208_g3544 [Fusarium decemcellulare]KAJ3546181.1 hypothetical protein NM208_g2130 [Fusarium decemcellulare]